jgi:hypothetical protein
MEPQSAMRRLMAVRREAVLLVTLALSLSGCAGSSDEPAPLAVETVSADAPSADVSRAAFLDGPGPGFEALMTGVLGGDARTGCLWIGKASGKQPVLFFDDDAHVDFTASPPELRTTSGQVHLRFGEMASLVGGYVEPEALGIEPVSGCPAVQDRVFVAGPLRR